MTDTVLEIEGFCPICELPAKFSAKDTWYRGSLICPTCPGGSVPRERALALVLNRQIPNWRNLSIHESSPAKRGISAKMLSEATNLVQTHYYPELPNGSCDKEYRNEDLQALTFSDNTFDIFVSLDVMEHIPAPELAVSEIYRTLKPSGYMLCTWPIRKNQVEAMDRRASFDPNGNITHLKEAEYHGNPINGEGALVTVDYGYEIHKALTYWGAFDVEITRFCDRSHGILGEYTEVIIAKKIIS